MVLLGKPVRTQAHSFIHKAITHGLLTDSDIEDASFHSYPPIKLKDDYSIHKMARDWLDTAHNYCFCRVHIKNHPLFRMLASYSY